MQLEAVASENPERMAIVHNLLEKMTVEAKFVLYTIFNTPGELSQLIFNQTGNPTDFEKIKWSRKTRYNKQLVRRYLRALNESVTNETIFLCSKCDKTFDKIGIQCECGGISRAETTGWKTKDINRTIFDIRQFLRELERV